MALKMRVRITGQDEVVRRLNMLGDKAKEVVVPAAMAGAEVVRDAAKNNVHNVSGFLQEHIIAQQGKAEGTKASVKIGPDRDAFYGLMVEFGHQLVRGSRKATRKVVGHVPAHPFLRPALDENKEKVEQVVAEEVRRRLGL